MKIKISPKEYSSFKEVLYKFYVTSGKDTSYETAIVSSKFRNLEMEREILLIQKDTNGKINRIVLGYCPDDVINLYTNNLPYVYSRGSDSIGSVISSSDRVTLNSNKWSSILTFSVSIVGIATETSFITCDKSVYLIQADISNDYSLNEIILGSYKDWKNKISLIQSSLTAVEPEEELRGEPIAISTTYSTYAEASTSRYSYARF